MEKNTEENQKGIKCSCKEKCSDIVHARNWKDWLVFISLGLIMLCIILWMIDRDQGKTDINENLEKRSPPIMFRDNLKGDKTI